jgi:hypothetical protein
MIRNYREAAEAIATELPSKIVNVETNPGFLIIFSETWHLVVFCHWWFNATDNALTDGDESDDAEISSIIESIPGRVVASFGYDDVRPEVVHVTFVDGAVLSFETDSDYEPWTIVTPTGSFTGTLSDFE